MTKKNGSRINSLVTGGAGFIGSHLVDRLLQENYQVVCVDNFILGKKENLREALKNPNFSLYNFDLLDMEKLNELFSKEKFHIVFHLAANSDIREGTKFTDKDLKLTFLTTYNVLECMRKHRVNKIVFTSSSGIYGYHNKPLKEESEMRPESLYGASKLASEAFIRAFSSLYDLQIWIFRLPNIVGERMTHGILFDFLRKIEKNPRELEVLGDGTQCKPYMYVLELIDCFLLVIENSDEQINVFNVGPKNCTKVTDIARILLNEMGEKLKIIYTGGSRGWKGDVPFYKYDSSKLEGLGWKPKMGSTEAVRFAIKKIKELR